MARGLVNKKGKGTVAERELIHSFWEKGWACVRVAGSGSSKYPSPDILAGNGERRYVMEVKTVNAYKKYFTRQEIDELNIFSHRFGAEAWVGIKFKESQWFFLPSSELPQTEGENYVIDVVTMKRTGFTFEDIT
jgi:Holliday junction resolvase